MAIGNRIKYFRSRQGMTQKQLGEMLGFLGKTSDVRMAQYESESRTPKQDLVKELAGIFDISTEAITVPNIDTYTGLMHTLFALEDMYGLKITEVDGKPMLTLDPSISAPGSQMDNMFHAWMEQSNMLSDNKISKAEYDKWRYNYPNSDESIPWAKVPSKGLNDLLLQSLSAVEDAEKTDKKQKKDSKTKKK